MDRARLTTARACTVRLWTRINSHVKANGLFRANDRVLLAVSGGPDSAVMLDYFAKQARRRGLTLLIAHLNHRIRGAAADRDEAFVKELGRRYGIETVTAAKDVPALAKKLKVSPEHAARTARYAFLSALARRKGFALVATAHHADDHAETVLLNLLRGTHPKGLLGIPVKRALAAGRPPVMVIRPLLAVTREEIMEYVKANGLDCRKDASNDDEKYRRNWLRKTLIPLIEKKQPQFRLRLTELSSRLRTWNPSTDVP